VNKKKILYQTICKETKEKIELHIVLVYFKVDKRFNYNLYIIYIKDRVS